MWHHSKPIRPSPPLIKPSNNLIQPPQAKLHPLETKTTPLPNHTHFLMCQHPKRDLLTSKFLYRHPLPTRETAPALSPFKQPTQLLTKPSCKTTLLMCSAQPILNNPNRHLTQPTPTLNNLNNLNSPNHHLPLRIAVQRFLKITP